MDRSELTNRLRAYSIQASSKETTDKEERPSASETEEDLTVLQYFSQLHQDTLRNLVAKQYKQHAPEWYEIRKTLATASIFGDLLYYPNTGSKRRELYQPYIDQFGSLPKPSSKHSNIGYSGHREAWIKRHHVPWTGGNEPCNWGTRFEDVAAALYETINKTKLIEYGLLIHPTYDWIGVSPDGMTVDGTLVEIKDPYMKMKPCALYYWVQCQLQMEVCDTSKPLHFFQCEMQLYAKKEDYLADEAIDSIERWKGAYVQLNKTKCIYPPYDKVPFNSDEMVSWCEQECMQQAEKWNAMSEDERKLRDMPEAPKAVYWKSNKIRSTVIERSREWFQGILAEAQLQFQSLMSPTFYPVTPKEINDVIRRETMPWSYLKPYVRVWSNQPKREQESGEERTTTYKHRRLPLNIGFDR